MKHLYKILTILSLLALASCTDKEQTLPNGAFRVADKYLNLSFSQEAQYQFIPVETNVTGSQWDISTSAPWCVAGASLTGAKGLMISVDENQEKDMRTAKVFVNVEANSYVFTVQQLGYGPAIIVSDVFIDAGGGTAMMVVTSNIQYEVSNPVLDTADVVPGEADWLTKTVVTKSLAESSFAYKVEPNYSAGRRSALITISATDRSLKDVDAVCTITQDYIADNNADQVMGKLTQMYATSVTAAKGDTLKYYSWDAELNWENAGGPDLIIDGSFDTYYCSPRGLNKTGDEGTYFPFEFTFNFENTPAIDYLKIYPIDGNGNQIASFNLYYKSAGMADFVQVNAPDVPYTCPLSGNVCLLALDEMIENPEQIKIEVLGTYWNLVKVAEIEFFKSNRSDVNYWIDQIFEDPSCSSLKKGVTKSLINKMAKDVPYIAKNAAMPLFQGTYDADSLEFRAHSYEAYSDPQAMKKKYNVRYYTQLDNPTGILARSGETLVVCADKIPSGHTLKLVVSGDTNEEHQFNCATPQFTFTLSEGVNLVPISLSGISEGLVFIVHTDAALTPSSKPIKVHILPGAGRVVGYFDLARHDDARFKEMLADYPYKYIIQKGANIITAFHAAQLRKPGTSSGMSSGLGFLDQIYDWEWELLGLTDQTEFNNHIMVISSDAEDAYMDAGDTRVRLGVSTLSNFATAEQIRVNAGAGPWGIAHEIGHINQPAICWESTIESSNNLFSNYCIYKSGITESRGYSITALANAYGRPWYKFETITKLYQNEDAELHMRMNWQLWNYFHRCLGDEDFWPRVFRIARANPAPGMFYSLFGYENEDPGTCQMMFYEQVCEAAQMDLTEFFETWGFFREVNTVYGQYSSGIKFKLDASMIAESKARVAAKNYPKAPAIQYLEDRTRCTRDKNDPAVDKDIRMGYWETFKNKVTITKAPKYSLSGRRVTITHYDQAVAVELRSKTTGELLYFSNLSDFTVPARTGGDKAIDLSNVKFQAVQWDGARVDM